MMEDLKIKNEENKEVDVGMKWDDEKKAYFPNIDDEFIYRYNLNYGFIEEENLKEKPIAAPENVAPTSYPDWYICLQNDFLSTFTKESIDISKITEEEYNDKWKEFYSKNAKKYEKKKMKPKKTLNKSDTQSWFEIDEDKIKHIYVANLPLDITLEEFIELVSKYGMLMYEPFTNIPKAKLYRDKEGNIKGDGICCYLKVESVDLAINFFDGYKLRGNVLKVSKAKFELKDDYVPKKKRKITNKEKRNIQKHQERLFRWDPETKTIRPKKDNTVIIKNAFDTELMKKNPELALDIKEKMYKETTNIGAFKSILVHDLHPEAVVQINFQDANFSDIAVAYFNNKIWNGRKITAAIWDGRTKYKVKETDDEEKMRLENWEKSLEGKSLKESNLTNDLVDQFEIDNIQAQSLKNLVQILEGGEVETEEPEEEYSDTQEGNSENVQEDYVNIHHKSECEHLMMNKDESIIDNRKNCHDSVVENFDK